MTMLRKWTALALPLLFSALACSAASIFSLTPTPTAYVYPTPETPSVPALTVDALKNAAYVLPDFSGAIRSYPLVDGEYSLGDPAVVGYASVALLDTFAFGDLNNDGVNDAAVLLAENYGGTGVFVSVNAVVNEGGSPLHAASYMIDDRPQVETLEIRGDEIYLEAVVHGPNDPGCCPSQSVTRSFELNDALLTLVRAATRLPDGRERAIQIESPLDGAEVGGELVITGSVTISPFENTLACRVYNEKGNELFIGAINVRASEMGGPGVFTVTLDASAFPPGRLRVVVADLSAADGSILALDSVEVETR